MCFHSHSYTMASDRETSTIKIRRKPSLKEKEHNMMRERKRRAITTKIFKGLRAQGNYNLSKHCDNNEVLKALCAEAGWLVEGDGTTYRKGYNDASTSTRTTPFSYSQNPSLISLSFPTSIPSYQFTPLSSPPLWISNNAPMTPLSSPTSTDLKPIPTWDSISKESMAFFNYPFVASSTLASPKHQNLHTPMKFQAFAQSSFAVPSSSTFNVVADNSIREMRSSKMLGVQIKPWVGEKVHDDGLDDLELTLGTGKGRI